NVDRGLSRVVMTAVERDRRNRYKTARALGMDLRRWLDGEDVELVTSPLMRWWYKVRPKVAIAVGLLASIVLVWTTGFYTKEIVRLREEHENAESAKDLRARVGTKSVHLAETLRALGKNAEADREVTDALSLLEKPDD